MKGREEFHRVLNSINENHERLASGTVNCIPLPYSRIKGAIPGIIQGKNWIVTASSGVGKSQFTKYTFVYHPYTWVKENPDKGIKLKILYFCLEESKEEFILSMISLRLFEKYRLRIAPTVLNGYMEYLDKTTRDKIAECEEFFSDMFDVVDVVDTINNPTGIYKYIRNYATENGTHHYKTIKIDGNDTEVYSHYTPNDPDEYVICITDHISLLDPEKGAETVHKAMSKFSANYGRMQVTKHYKYIFVMVQQQAADTEKEEFTRTGASIIDKIKPSLSGLGDNKMTQRDQFYVLSLFAPDRYSHIKTYQGYDISIFKDNIRFLTVLKNREGISNIELPLYFDGACYFFQELPRISKSPTGERHIGRYPENEFYDRFLRNRQFWIE